MSLRWFVCPVDSDAHARWPRIARLVDPARTPHTYRFIAAISDGLPGQINGRCLVLVRSTDYTPIMADPQIIDIFEGEYENGSLRFLLRSPRDLGWSAAKMRRIRDRLVAWEVDITGLTADSALWRFLLRVGQRIQPGWDPRRLLLRES